MSLHFLSEITGSFSQPAAENPTVAMVEAAYKEMKIDWRYINCEVPPALLADAVAGAKAMNWQGFNCSVPHKVAVIAHLDGLGESAQLIGAVNTVVKRGDDYIGENTDGKGFLQGLRQQVEPHGKSVMILGAGGAARAIAVELALAGVASITIVNRNKNRGQTLVDLLNGKTTVKAHYLSWDKTIDIPEDIDILVNSTTIGLYPHVEQEVNINSETLRAEMVVADVIPNPPKTKLLEAAQAKGCQVIDGLAMLVNQGVLGIKYWTGHDANSDVMRQTLNAIFAK
ncbi:shikimate dehydrogenase [Flavobacterium sp. W21_SRS_FM6]|uniref:shikimate dehydrogenase n=1 Tax=Flavobacterium sp. W21_SRS_FM6 TaxID=3240268 RepID=UPI003F934601